MTNALAFKALGNDRRLQILAWLKDPRANFPPQVDGDLVEDGVCGVRIAEKLGVSQPTLGGHGVGRAGGGKVDPGRTAGSGPGPAPAVEGRDQGAAGRCAGPEGRAGGLDQGPGQRVDGADLDAVCSPAVVLEANFRPKSAYERRMLSGLGGRLVEVYCRCPPEEASRRYSARSLIGERHAIHTLRDLPAALLAEFDRPVGHHRPGGHRGPGRQRARAAG